MNDTTDMLALRWRAAQWLLAVSDGDGKQVAALNEAMRIEGIDQADILDELALLRDQFGRRTRVWLVEEIERLWQKLKERP